MSTTQHLYRFPLFAGLPEGVIRAIAFMSEEITVNAGEWLFHEGQRADAMYVILSGTVDLKMAINAERIDLADLERLTDGDLIGWSSLVEPRVYTLSAIAVTDVHLVKLDADGINDLLDQNPEAGYTLIRRLIGICRRRLTNMHTRFVSLVTAESL